MAGFDDFINPVENTGVEELPVFKGNLIDFRTGEHVIVNGNFVKVEKIDALRVWVWKCLKTERNTYEAYSSSYGNDLKKELGYVYDRSVKEQLLYNEIRKSLLVNPYLTSVSNFTTEKTVSGSDVTIYFDIGTIYGEINGETEVTI